MKKLFIIIKKSLKEQWRSFWILLLSLSMGPFFIFVYYLITSSSKAQYDILIVNNDSGIEKDSIFRGKDLVYFFQQNESALNDIPFKAKVVSNKEQAVDLVRSKSADALIDIPDSFSLLFQKGVSQRNESSAKIEFVGDLTSSNYLISAVWANEVLNTFVLEATNSKRIVEVRETALGVSGKIDEFDMLVPGILIVSLIMLMFTASIAFVSEVENKTIMRLKLSKITAFEFLGGISAVQLLVGIVSVVLTLLTALALGFNFSGSIIILFFIAGLTSLSIISFSLIIAALTRSSNEVLVAGNFPMFLFMFFTGAAFPLKIEALFSITGYPVNFQGLMTPTHAISALNKTFVMNMGIIEILPEIIAILFLSLIYFLLGGFLFRKRHLKLS